MFSFTNLLIGIVMTALGVAGLKYTFVLHNFTGPQDWLERYAGAGSTVGIYKIFSVLLVMVGILVATGFGDNFMSFFLSPLRNMFKPLGS